MNTLETDEPQLCQALKQDKAGEAGSCLSDSDLSRHLRGSSIDAVLLVSSWVNASIRHTLPGHDYLAVTVQLDSVIVTASSASLSH